MCRAPSRPYHLPWFWPVIVLELLTLTACGAVQGQDLIHLVPADNGELLRVEYRFAQPTSAVVFARTPDSSRRDRWHIESPEFEWAQVDGSDALRRNDGAEFLSVEVSVGTTYAPLPKDYAPFSPFSDGGYLVHSGRFHACPYDGGDDAPNCDGPWLMQIDAPSSAHIILRGNRHDDTARWSDSGNGTKIYVGQAVPRSNDNFIGIVDPALPAEVSDLMSGTLPSLMSYYSQRLPELNERPMLFASYDPDYKNGYGRQGGTLPGQVFMHFYGKTWDSIEADDKTPGEIAWFFAHEAGHLFQHEVTGDRDSAWIHEGAAEAFALFALNDLGAVPTDFLEERRNQSFNRCADALGVGSLDSVAERGTFSDFYDCGLTLFIAIDDAIRAKSADERNLYDFWSSIVAESDNTEPLDAATFLSVAAPWTGDTLADRVLAIVVEAQADPRSALAELQH